MLNFQALFFAKFFLPWPTHFFGSTFYYSHFWQTHSRVRHAHSNAPTPSLLCGQGRGSGRVWLAPVWMIKKIEYGFHPHFNQLCRDRPDPDLALYKKNRSGSDPRGKTGFGSRRIKMHRKPRSETYPFSTVWKGLWIRLRLTRSGLEKSNPVQLEIWFIVCGSGSRLTGFGSDPR